MLKPKHLSQKYGDQFQDLSIATSYRKRPSYDSSVIDVIAKLAKNDHGKILDLGCGTGELAIPLSRKGFSVDAVDPSEAMLRVAGNDASTVNWHCSYGEDFSFSSKYELVCCANSLHWMDWDIVFPKFSSSLIENGFIVLVTDGDIDEVLGYSDVVKVIQSYSTNQDFQTFSLLDELQSNGYFKLLGSVSTGKKPVTQPLKDYIESFHARNGLSVERMGKRNAELFDLELTKILHPHLIDGNVHGFTNVTVSWGFPNGAYK